MVPSITNYSIVPFPGNERFTNERTESKVFKEFILNELNETQAVDELNRTDWMN